MATQNKYWDLKPGKTKAIEYDANGVKVKEWNYKETNVKEVFIWEEVPLK